MNSALSGKTPLPAKPSQAADQSKGAAQAERIAREERSDEPPSSSPHGRRFIVWGSAGVSLHFAERPSRAWNAQPWDTGSPSLSNIRRLHSRMEGGASARSVLSVYPPPVLMLLW